MNRRNSTLLSLAVLLSSAGPLLARPQSNTVVGQDVALGLLGNITVVGRQGTFPAGVNALAMSTTSCNTGTVDIDWFAAMNPAHPFISFILVRDMNGRMVQISDRSYIKHGFFATNNSQCTPCIGPPGSTQLGVGCSDTYSTSHNSDQYYLGAPDEINPWLGTWTVKCSQFDRGEPAVSAPADCDAVRSLTHTQATALGPVAHRLDVLDVDLDQAATFYYQAQYTIRGEAESARDNNLGSRPFIPAWNGSNWTATQSGSFVYGSVLQRWSGASLSSNTNGVDDGRLYVAVKVTGPVNCVYHYEYAVHNRDNARGMNGFRIPIASGGLVLNPGFHDVDANAGNDWTFSTSANEITFATTNHALQWNTIFNFWFDSDVAPQTGVALSLDQVSTGLGGGAPFVSVTSTAPTGSACTDPGVYCAAKVNSLGCTPAIAFSGSPSASVASPFDITASLELNNKLGLLFYGYAANNAPFQGGIQCVLQPIRRTPLQDSGGSPTGGDCSGAYSYDFNARIQSGIDAALVSGAVVYAQYWSRDGGDPSGFGTNLSDALRFTIQP